MHESLVLCNISYPPPAYCRVAPLHGSASSPLWKDLLRVPGEAAGAPRFGPLEPTTGPSGGFRGRLAAAGGPSLRSYIS